MTTAGKERSGKLWNQPYSHINRTPWIHDPHQCPRETLLLQLVVWPGSMLLHQNSSFPFPLCLGGLKAGPQHEGEPAASMQQRAPCRVHASLPVSPHCPAAAAEPPCDSRRAEACRELRPALCAAPGLYGELWDRILHSKPTKSSSSWSLKLYGLKQEEAFPSGDKQRWFTFPFVINNILRQKSQTDPSFDS